MIRKLSQDVVGDMKSHLNFCNASQIMEKYVNDAINIFKANAVDIIFDLDNFRLEMKDNGDGIAASQLTEFTQYSCILLSATFALQ